MLSHRNVVERTPQWLSMTKRESPRSRWFESLHNVAIEWPIVGSTQSMLLRSHGWVWLVYLDNFWCCNEVFPICKCLFSFMYLTAVSPTFVSTHRPTQGNQWWRDAPASEALHEGSPVHPIQRGIPRIWIDFPGSMPCFGEDSATKTCQPLVCNGAGWMRGDYSAWCQHGGRAEAEAATAAAGSIWWGWWARPPGAVRAAIVLFVSRAFILKGGIFFTFCYSCLESM